MSSPTLAEPQMNATPLIDVLLVLLVMIIFTLPVGTHAVKLNLPHRVDVSPKPTPVVLVNIDFDGALFWDGQPVARDALDRKLSAAAAAQPAPRVKIVPDKRVRYEEVALVLAAAQRQHVTALEVAPVDL